MPELPRANEIPEHAGLGYETTDARIGPILGFAIGLAVFTVVVQLGLAWLFDVFRADARRESRPLPALAETERLQLPRDVDEIPKPRLQKSELADFQKQRQEEESLLHSYGWVDRDAGILRIPIEEAMRILADPTSAKAHGIRVKIQEQKK